MCKLSSLLPKLKQIDILAVRLPHSFERVYLKQHRYIERRSSHDATALRQIRD